MVPMQFGGMEESKGPERVGESILLSCIFSFSEFPVFSLLGVDFSLKQQFSTTVLPLRGCLQCLGYFWLSQLRQGGAVGF